jgi:poly(rC)-binding protein 3/4
MFQWLSIPEERPYYASEDERIVEIQGETLNVQNALQLVVGHLRKFLVDQSILPLFEKIVSLSNRPERSSSV